VRRCPGMNLRAPLANSKTAVSIADVLEREVESTIKYWLQRVNLIPAFANVPLSDVDRIGYLPELHMGLVCCLRFAKDGRVPLSAAADEHGTVRNAQGYSANLFIEEFRAFWVAVISTLHLHQKELNQNLLLSDIMAIEDEVEAQLVRAMRALMGAKMANSRSFAQSAKSVLSFTPRTLVTLSLREHTLQSGDCILLSVSPEMRCCMSAASGRFFHRSNADGSYDSICMTCYRTIDTQPWETALAIQEEVHFCNEKHLLPQELIEKEDRHPADPAVAGTDAIHA
jgi:hypothetical protein